MPSAAPSFDRHRVAVLVLGMHRSGTSALTWLVGQMGATLPRDAIGPGAENAKGYWESAALVAADDALVRAAGSSWFDPRPPALDRVPAALLAERLAGVRAAFDAGWGEAPLLAVKDPRLCRLVEPVATLLRDDGIEPRAVLMLRPAAEVAASLQRRDGTIPAYGSLLWLRHMLDAERDSRGLMRAVVGYEALLGDWRTVTARVAPLLGREGWSPTDGGAAIDAFLDPALRHAVGAGAADLPPELHRLVDAAERGLAALAVRDSPAERDALDRVRARLAALPWLEADIAHDELRHRRVPAAAPDAAPQPAPEPPAPAPRPAPEPLPDPAGDAALVRGSGLFDADWYARTYPDVAPSGLDPVDHYLRLGAARGYRPNPLFDTAYYARQMARRTAGAERPR